MTDKPAPGEKPEWQCPAEKVVDETYRMCCMFRRGHPGPHGSLPIAPKEHLSD